MDSDRGIRRVSTYRADSSLLLLGRLRLATETFDHVERRMGRVRGHWGVSIDTVQEFPTGMRPRNRREWTPEGTKG